MHAMLQALKAGEQPASEQQAQRPKQQLRSCSPPPPFGASASGSFDLLRLAPNSSRAHLEDKARAKKEADQQFSTEVFDEQLEFEGMVEARMEEATEMSTALGRPMVYMPHRVSAATPGLKL